MFLKSYSQNYDSFYKKKNYKKEVDFLTSQFKDNTEFVLDIACGTGNHCILLDKLGYKVYGQDQSEFMISQAKKKAKHIDFTQKSMQNFDLLPMFDAVICMFSSIDYLINHIDILRTFNNVYDCLNPGGRFIFDFWHKPCVERNFSHMRKLPDRYSMTELDTANNLATITFYFKNDTETHKLRYFPLDEMELLLNAAKFREFKMFPFMKPTLPITKDTWNISVVAKK